MALAFRSELKPGVFERYLVPDANLLGVIFETLGTPAKRRFAYCNLAPIS